MPKFTLRLTDDQHTELVASAQANGRSLQREIIQKLFGPTTTEFISGDGVVIATRSVDDPLGPPQVLPELPAEPVLPAVSAAKAAREMSELAAGALTAGDGEGGGRTPETASKAGTPATPAVSVSGDPKPESGRRAKPSSNATKGFCPHRRPLGAYCKRCGEVVA